MAVDTSNLVTLVQARIDGLTGSEDITDLLVIRKAADNLGLDLTAIEAAITTKLNAFTSSTASDDLLAGNRAASLAGAVNEAISPIGGINRFPSLYGPSFTKYGATFMRSGTTATIDELDESLHVNTSMLGTQSWASVPISFSGAAINSVATDNLGTWIAVGAQSTYLARSDDDGASWTSINHGVGASHLLGIATDGQGVWIAVVNGGSIIRSDDDGLTWTTLSYGSTDTLRSIATDGQGVWVAVGYYDRIVRSTDNGLTWTILTTRDTNLYFQSVAIDGQGVWVAVGNSGLARRSTDNGATWVDITIGSIGFNSITTDKAGNWLAGGTTYKLFKSVDNGATWSEDTRITIDFTIYTIAMTDEVWTMAGSANAALSSTNDGESWFNSSINVGSSVGIKSLAAGGNNTWLAFSDNGAGRKAVIFRGITFNGENTYDYLRIR